MGPDSAKSQPSYLERRVKSYLEERQRRLEEFVAEQKQLAELKLHAMAAVVSRPEEAYCMLQALLVRESDWQRSLDVCQRENAGNERAQLLFSAAQAAFLAGRLDEARDALNEAASLFALSSHPSLALIWHQLGLVFLASGSLTEAERSYGQAYEMAMASGLWDTAVMALDGRADCEQYQGHHTDFWSRLDQAIALARSHALPSLEQTLARKRILREIALDPTGEALGILKSIEEQRRLAADKVNRLILSAEYLIHRGDPATALEWLLRAEELIAPDSLDRWNLLWNLAAACAEVPGRFSQALRYAEQGLAAAEQHQMQDQRKLSLLQLIGLYTRSEAPEHEARTTEMMARLRELGQPQILAHALLDTALALFEKRQFQKALDHVAEAEQFSDTLDLRGLVFTARTATLQAMGRLAEALEANERAIALGAGQLLAVGATAEAATAGPGWARSGRSDHVEALYGNAALLLAQDGRFRQAFQRAEEGRAWRLRSELAQGGGLELGDHHLPAVQIDDLRTLLKADGAAVALFWMGLRQTLVLVIDPRLDQLERHVIDFGAAEARTLFQKSQGGPRPWPERILAPLSERLAPALNRVSQACSVLCLVPDSHLYFAPFAALTFSDQTRLIDRCALALAPSATVLAWLRAHRSKGLILSCLAAGIGGEDVNEPSGRGRIAFADQAREVAALGWSMRALLAEPSVAEFWEHAKRFSILHLACHGAVEATVPGTLSASALKFADRPLSAKEVFGHKSELNAELVFLNACLSGQFALHSGGEVGGFWEAFLRAGARSLIATLTRVDPRSAHELALEFYRQWLTERISKAEALRRAQLRLANRGMQALHWASHVLIGDYS